MEAACHPRINHGCTHIPVLGLLARQGQILLTRRWLLAEGRCGDKSKPQSNRSEQQVAGYPSRLQL